MKRLLFFILIFVLLVFSSCKSDSPIQKSDDSNTTGNNSLDSIQEKLLGTWETSFNNNTLICVFDENGEGRFIGNGSEPMPFTYQILNENQLVQTMVTIEGKEDTSVYNFEFKDDKLIFDGFTYTKK